MIVKMFHHYQSVISLIGYRLFGIDYICRMLETSDSYITQELLRKYGARLGQHINFKGGIIIDNASKDQDATNDFRNLIIGNSCYIGKKVFFDLANEIIIENEVVISARVSIFTHADCGNRLMSNHIARKTGSVRIGKGTWIGANATILCGVHIGELCVVAAGAVVTTSFDSNQIVAGVPARKIGDVKEDIRC